jgi:phosphomannomutase
MFDVDGTITPSLQRMENKFLFFFLSWMEDKKVFLVGGSDKGKIFHQVSSSVIDRCGGVFCCMGNELWQGDKLVYKNEFDPPIQLREMLTSFQMYTKFPIKPKAGGRGVIFEHRSGMLNFTTIGRNADTQERLKYYEWDKEHGERKYIAEVIEEDFPDLEARIGGKISIDIQPRGFNKSQASKWVRENVDENIVFFGDNCMEGGNDNDIYLDVKNNGGFPFQVKDPSDTEKVLENLDKGEIKLYCFESPIPPVGGSGYAKS